MASAINLPPSSEKGRLVIDLDIDLNTSPPTSPDETPLTPILCLKNKVDMKAFEEKEDCFILDFDPDQDDSLELLSLSSSQQCLENADISVIAEKGQVACRDYPHPRYACAKFPFEKTPHGSYCKLCYCYVCDVAAPCYGWMGLEGHCHALDNVAWRYHRQEFRHSNRQLPNARN